MIPFRFARLCLSLLLVAFLGSSSWGASVLRGQGPTLEHLSLWVRALGPGEFRAKARLTLTGVTHQRVSVILNDGLEVLWAKEGERELSFQYGLRPFSGFHRESRVVLFELGRVPEDGRVVLEVHYRGEAESGSTGPDWRGILYVGEDEMRMSEQTVFYPQLMESFKGPGIQASPVEVTVEAPPRFEVFVPAPLVSHERVEGRSADRWVFRSDDPTVLSLLGGRYKRREVEVDGAKISLLLRREHASLGPELAGETRAALGYFTEQFGPSEGGVLGVVEIDCRDGTSINWASQGVIALDRGAFGNGVPVPTVAHEVAHLWWGQRTTPSGAGERFLTESFAEYWAWRYLEASGRPELAARELEDASEAYRGAYARGRDTRLAEVTFGTPGYSALAYAKGPLALRNIENLCGREVLDASFVRYANNVPPTLAGWIEALEESIEGRLPAAAAAWLGSDGHPSFVLSEIRGHDRRIEGVLEATGWPSMDLEGAAFELDLVLEQGREKQSIRLDGLRTPFAFDCSSKPLALRPDPRGFWPGERTGDFVLDGPVLVASDPVRGEREAAVGGRLIRLEFDREMAAVDLASLTMGQRRERNRDPSTVARVSSVEVQGRVVLLRTQPWRPARDYVLELRGLFTDERGVPVMDDALRFRTAEPTDAVGPRVITTVPGLGDRVGIDEITSIVVTFNEPMSASRGFRTTLLREFEAQGLLFPPVHDIEWTPDYRSLILPVESLVPQTRYILPIRGTHYRDVSGNQVEDFDLLFSTEPD